MAMKGRNLPKKMTNIWLFFPFYPLLMAPQNLAILALFGILNLIFSKNLWKFIFFVVLVCTGNLFGVGIVQGIFCFFMKENNQ